MIVGFTGTRVGMTTRQVLEVLRVVRSVRAKQAHHGGCIGADHQFHLICEATDVWTVVHWSDIAGTHAPVRGDEERPMRPALERNKDIVAACDLLIVAPKQMSEVLRSGTWATYREAGRRGVETLIIYPHE
jgi:hypothetical protein